MSRTPCLTSFVGIGSIPHSGMPGPPCGPALRRISTWSAVTSRSGSSIAFFIDGYQRGPGMPEETRLAGGRFDDAAVGREIALQHRERALFVDRIVDRPDDVVVID